MAIFNSYVKLPEGICWVTDPFPVHTHIQDTMDIMLQKTSTEVPNVPPHAQPQTQDAMGCGCVCTDTSRLFQTCIWFWEL